jgi:hypothetical protein
LEVVHCKRESYTKYIGRGSDLGNPFTHLPLSRTKAYVQVPTVEDAVACCEDWARGSTAWDHIIPRSVRDKFLAAIHTLYEDDVLGCYCVPYHACHGEVVAKLWKESHVQ